MIHDNELTQKKLFSSPLQISLRNIPIGNKGCYHPITEQMVSTIYKHKDSEDNQLRADTDAAQSTA